MRINDPDSAKVRYEKRRQRLDEAGEAREFTFCCYKRFPFLGNDRTRKWFVGALNSAKEKYPFDLWAYVIMPDHVHLLLYPRDPALKLGPVVGEIKEEVGRKTVSHLRRFAPEWLSKISVQEGKRQRHRIWQPGGGFDRNATEIRTLHYMINYIHANPVRRGLVERPEDWYWSSAQWYAKVQPVPIQMDSTFPMMYLNDK